MVANWPGIQPLYALMFSMMKGNLFSRKHLICNWLASSHTFSRKQVKILFVFLLRAKWSPRFFWSGWLPKCWKCQIQWIVPGLLISTGSAEEFSLEAPTSFGDGLPICSSRGGVEKAVLVYAAEHHPSGKLMKHPVQPSYGAFGENFRKSIKPPEAIACIGDIYDIAKSEQYPNCQPCWNCRVAGKSGI